MSYAVLGVHRAGLTPVALAGLLVSVGACTSLRRVEPAAFLSQNNPDVVWVTHVDKSIVPVAQPEITGDTLRGMRQGTQERVAIPLDQVRSVQAKLPDRTKTLLAIAGGLTGFVGSVYMLWISKAGPNTDGVSCGVYGSANEGPYGDGAARQYC